jgi:N-acetylmuramoyl-L-alanine amidase
MKYVAKYHLVLALSVFIALSVLVFAYISEDKGRVPADTAATAGETDTRAATVTGNTNSVSTTATVQEVNGVNETPELRAAQPEPESPPAGSSLAGMVICIDPGHASNPDPGVEANGPGSTEMKVKDPGGTGGVSSGTPEYVIAMDISLNLQHALEAAGATVVMTRTSDTYYGGNIERAEAANAAGADLFIRIHCDGSTDSSKNGVSTLYPALIPGWTDDIYESSYEAAVAVQSAMVNGLGAADNGTVARSDITGFNWADVPAILVETGFLTNPQEDSLLNSSAYQAKVADSLVQGITEFLSAS